MRCPRYATAANCTRNLTLVTLPFHQRDYHILRTPAKVISSYNKLARRQTSKQFLDSQINFNQPWQEDKGKQVNVRWIPRRT